MNRLKVVAASIVAAGAVLAGVGALPAHAETIYFQFPALPGPVANCQWFDDNINERSDDAIVRQTDLIYNRLALTPNTNATVTGSATTKDGGQVVQFDVGGRLMCAESTVMHPEQPEPSPSPPG
jgi:hypothetical protein